MEERRSSRKPVKSKKRDSWDYSVAPLKGNKFSRWSKKTVLNGNRPEIADKKTRTRPRRESAKILKAQTSGGLKVHNNNTTSNQKEVSDSDDTDDSIIQNLITNQETALFSSEDETSLEGISKSGQELRPNNHGNQKSSPTATSETATPAGEQESSDLEELLVSEQENLSNYTATMDSSAQTISLLLERMQKLEKTLEVRTTSQARKGQMSSNADNPNFPITKEVIESVKYVTASNFISQLLPQLYDEKTLMTHSLHGRKPNKFKDGDNLKNGLPAAHKAQLIIATQKAAALAGKPEVGKTEIFRAISVKLGNEHKKMKK